MELSEVTAESLDEWIMHHLQLTGDFNKELRNAVHRIAEALKTQEGVIRVVKGGSSGKGTALKNTSDADLVLFLQCFKSFQDQLENREAIISNIYCMLNKCRQSIAFDIDISQPKEKRDPWGQPVKPRSLSFTIKSRKGSPPIEVDVLPAFDALGNFIYGSIPDPQVYVSLIEAGGRPGEFSCCFTELQRDFVKRIPSKLKNLIRLVKYWYKQDVKSRYPKDPLPHKYALELLTIYCWQKGSGREDFKSEEGFCTFLQLLSRPQDLCIYWTKYYNFENRVVKSFVNKQLKKPRPIILDPADPTGIVGWDTRWDLVADKAADCLTQMCCRDRSGDPVKAWDVPPCSCEQIQIFVIDFNNKSKVYHVCLSETVLSLKKKIEERQNISSTQQILTYGTKPLKDCKTLAFYDIENESNIFLSLRLRGGACGSGSKQEAAAQLTLPVSVLVEGEPLCNHRAESPQASDCFTSKLTACLHLQIQPHLLRAGRHRIHTESAKLHTPCPACSKANMDLCKASAKELDIFIGEKLQPNKGFLDQMGVAVDTVCTFLKENCFKGSTSKMKVLKVVKGGSAGKGTTLKGRSDADLVVFLSCFTHYTDQENNRGMIINEIREKLNTYKKDKGFTITIAESKWPNPRVLSFHLKLDGYQEVIECDVLPAYDALGQVFKGRKPDRQVYKALLDVGSPGGAFSTCFTELQKDFIIERPTKVKSLIRLVKHWYKSCFEERHVSKLPPKYALELLTIHAWEKDGQKLDFNMADLFHKVLKLICDFKMLCVYWLKYYDEDLLTSQLQKPRPIILDPADPTGIVGWDTRWDLVADKAADCLTQMCCRDRSGDPVKAWDVPPCSCEQIQIFVIDFNNKSKVYHVCLSETVLSLKKKIEERQNISSTQQILTYGTKPLKDCKTLAFYDIENESNIFLSLRLRGGASKLVLLRIGAFLRYEGSRVGQAVAVTELGKRNSSKGWETESEKEGNHSFYEREKHCPSVSGSRSASAPGVTLKSWETPDSHRISQAPHSLPCLLKSKHGSCKASAKELDIFIGEKLQPNKGFLDQMGVAVDTVCTFLKENCFKGSTSKMKVLKVVKGGSAGKGTTLKGRSDADLVVFLSCFTHYTDQENNRGMIINEIREKLNTYKKDKGFTITIAESKWPNPRVLSFHLKLDGYQEVIECDVLPAYDALGQVFKGRKPDRQVYKALLDVGSPGGAFSTCFTELQKDFIIERPTKVKSLIRLVKHWYKSCFEERRVSKLPPKYALELLTIHAWEKDGQKLDFNMADLFHKVLKLICGFKMLCVYWLKYYDEDLLTSQLQKPRPIIMDPADPTGNLGEGFRWDVLAEAAASCMSQPAPIDLCINASHQSVRIASVDPYNKIQRIKDRIQLEMGISTNSQCLFLGDQELLDHYSLANYGVFSTTTLNLKAQGSWCSIL
ncbi:uncharacterized protein LOC115073073 [Rhinatrema bivittatum]|uniref:uncharacterized protein LOC115073073 n=1 Tax=Rhinatrema bivittatum TaxID=194408 RepID=UPI001129E183|nr:uncharacterized protein LOC115073073 [Rhinatrema bivittatum]